MKAEIQSLAYRDHNLIASTGFTVLRFLIALGIGVAFLQFGAGTTKEFAVTGTLLIVAFDYFDGIYFAKSPVASQKDWRIFRRKADSIADRLVIQLVCIPLLLTDPAFFWFYVAIALREAVISGYNSWLYQKGIIVYPSNIAKFACAFVSLVGISYLTLPSIVTSMITGIMLVFSGLSLLDYRRRVSEANVIEPKSNDDPYEIV